MKREIANGRNENLKNIGEKERARMFSIGAKIREYICD